jgi:pyridoxal phosphate enzyme (YggS family)
VIATRFPDLQKQVALAAARGNFKQLVRILPVTKTVDVATTNECIAVQKACGVTPVIGESYIGDYLKKLEFLNGGFESHFIGPLQDSAVGKVVRVFDVIHSVHSIPIALKIGKESRRLKKKVSIFIQVNVSNDPAKQGILAEELSAAINAAGSEGLPVLGLMTITQNYENSEGARADFAKLRTLRDTYLPGGELSMGMSGDYEVAVEEGATVIRVGSALFSPKL